MTDPDDGRQPEESSNGAARGEASPSSEDPEASQTLDDGDQTRADRDLAGGGDDLIDRADAALRRSPRREE